MSHEKNIYHLKEEKINENENTQLSNQNEDLVTEDKLKDLYIFYESIIKDSEIKAFIYKCLALDLVAFFLYEYEMVDNFSKVENILLGILYSIKYLTSAFNGVLYIFYIIFSRNENGNAFNKPENRLQQTKSDITIREYLEESFNAGEHIKINNIHVIELTKAQLIIKYLHRIKLVTWFMKYFAYAIYMILNPYINAISYFSVLVLLIDYYQYFTLKFYYYVILRTEYLYNYLRYKSINN
jgi:hypothetical protein